MKLIQKIKIRETLIELIDALMTSAKKTEDNISHNQAEGYSGAASNTRDQVADRESREKISAIKDVIFHLRNVITLFRNTTIEDPASVNAFQREEALKIYKSMIYSWF